MVRRKLAIEAPEPRVSRKRELPNDPYEVPDEADTPKRRRRRLEPKSTVHSGINGEIDWDNDDVGERSAVVQESPTKRRGRPPKSAATATPNGQTATPSTRGQRIFAETPLKPRPDGIDTPSRRTIADRSARKKSARALIDRVIGGAVSDDEVEEDIAREIYESSANEEEDAEEDEQGDQDEGQHPTTPSKSPGRKRRAHPRKRSPTPPRELPPHEQYFYQNKPGLAKTSNNTLSTLDLLTHDEYFSVLRQLQDPHAADVDFLQSLHAQSFPQWAFELSQGFSTCLYGYGSKRRLLHNFATYLSSQHPTHRIVIINGYVRTLTARDILSTLATALPSSPASSNSTNSGGGGAPHPSSTVGALLTHLSSTPITLTILINSIDGPPLRKPALQSLLSHLAAHPQIRLACTADTPDFPLLWDAGQRAAFNFLFHDCTTFAAFAPCELEVVDEVHELLGRRARRAGGKEGVVFVLRSLPENARALFRLLAGEVLVAMDEQGGAAAAAGGEEVGVEYRMVYNRAVEEFICSSEMAFRTLLKE
ncbi:uncharacterized protein THITE_2107259 [Thermothielavioides terrestris NRRL 8126]|uniref:Origin recognition complex subunit 2 n=2 Tax=Thermothielavioides terrestris TaxID=2587410 RepID=G2QTC3_THETT|nr:uncharacterized protein THITE_2107259 [Thermothielavioides terrestris NRRL 8126]AEO62740.1 hypothetical protein THITE_2107259 [Thermothielavioides terrestris NRRL 8126]